MSQEMLNKVQLIIGGARSGKSALAERYAKLSNLPVIYIATAQAFDSEMQQRIAQHQADRPDHWLLIESPLFLAKTIASAIENNQQDICILVDCLTLWLSNSLCKPNVEVGHTSECNLDYWQQEKQQFLIQLESIKQQAGNGQKRVEIILVSNEVGHGIVPMGELSRQFVDQAGWLHQAIASIADNVEFVMAGLPLTLKSPEATKDKL
ncbi:bifunctional adenosylcobinamide kinase/adenosylcobinamide-phosphate guanylyltransferase [Cognaticolwellia mytili]|uniref:bifunctional adenosylcobinamide kinase/adenosylcobinamide-phosphate guanylyltransferase n=1 Tax=Cognaticolwellia mytili TaxID=1888913 RepID=UPI001F1C18AA|nr:bifunctional adenosylcobinamide kinase/adenosylcobinamide-phosphate guanylyltransferase [Cognaticolwellia mytili]